MDPLNLTRIQRASIFDILIRRSNEIAHYSDSHRNAVPGSVEMALTNEMARLRSLAESVKPTPIAEDVDDCDS